MAGPIGPSAMDRPSGDAARWPGPAQPGWWLTPASGTSRWYRIRPEPAPSARGSWTRQTVGGRGPGRPSGWQVAVAPLPGSATPEDRCRARRRLARCSSRCRSRASIRSTASSSRRAGLYPDRPAVEVEHGLGVGRATAGSAARPRVTRVTHRPRRDPGERGHLPSGIRLHGRADPGTTGHQLDVDWAVGIWLLSAVVVTAEPRGSQGAGRCAAETTGRPRSRAGSRPARRPRPLRRPVSEGDERAPLA